MNMHASWFPSAALIGGEWVTSKETFDVTDPATGAVVGRVPNLGPAETLQAIDAAQAALPAWSAKTAKDRAIILRRWFDLVTAETERLAQLMTAEQGKPLAEARGDSHTQRRCEKRSAVDVCHSSNFSISSITRFILRTVISSGWSVVMSTPASLSRSIGCFDPPADKNWR